MTKRRWILAVMAIVLLVSAVIGTGVAGARPGWWTDKRTNPAPTPTSTPIPAHKIEPDSPYDSGKVMIVFWVKAGDTYLMSIAASPEQQVVDDGEKLYIDGRLVVNDLTTIGYGYFWYEQIDPGDPEAPPVTIASLGLTALPPAEKAQFLNPVDPADLANEIAALKGRVSELENKVAQLEKDDIPNE